LFLKDFNKIAHGDLFGLSPAVDNTLLDNITATLIYSPQAQVETLKAF
jgi:hypothetical protein